MKKYTKLVVEDDPGEGGACHKYSIADNLDSTAVYAGIKFQKGPIHENGVNGCQNEDLLKVIVHRLQGFQSGEFSCRENAIALTKIQEALHWLEHRTKDRENRGVEGLNKN